MLRYELLEVLHKDRERLVFMVQNMQQVINYTISVSRASQFESFGMKMLLSICSKLNSEIFMCYLMQLSESENT